MAYSDRNCMVSKEIAERIRREEAKRQKRVKEVELAFSELKNKIVKKEGEIQNGSF